MGPSEWLANAEATIAGQASPGEPWSYAWELMFAREVLARLDPGVVADFSHITAQMGFRDLQGRERRVDFAFNDRSVRIAVEVDGRNKTGMGESGSASRARFEDWQQRERALVVAGWKPFRFANTEFARYDPATGLPVVVPEGAARCVEHLQLLILRERAVAEALRREVETGRRMAGRVREAEARWKAANQRLAEAESRGRLEGQREMEEELTAARDALRRVESEAAAERLGDSATARLEALQAEHDRTLAHARRQREAAERERQKTEQKRRSDMKFALAALGITAVAAIGAVVWLLSRDGDEADPVRAAGPTVAASEEGLTLQSLSNPVAAGADATIRLLAAPDTECTIEYVTPAGTASDARGLVPRTTDARGNVSWTWTIGSLTAPGSGTVRVECGGAKGEWSFQVTRQ